MAREESKEGRLDRELEELLQELRVALPGVQILFAFLLIAPFNRRFEELSALQAQLYVVALLCTLAAVVLLIAPTAYHRIRFREYDKERLVFTSNLYARFGLVFLALGLCASVFFVTDFVFGRTLSLAVSAGAVLAFGWTWFGLPLARKLMD